MHPHAQYCPEVRETSRASGERDDRNHSQCKLMHGRLQLIPLFNIEALEQLVVNLCPLKFLMDLTWSCLLGSVQRRSGCRRIPFVFVLKSSLLHLEESQESGTELSQTASSFSSAKSLLTSCPSFSDAVWRIRLAVEFKQIPVPFGGRYLINAYDNQWVRMPHFLLK